MTESKIRELLYAYEQLKKDRDALCEEIPMAKARLASVYGGCHSGSVDDIHVINGGVGDPVCNAVVGQIIPEREHLQRMISRLEAKDRAIDQVDQFLDMLDALERTVIECRYFKRLTWAQVVHCAYMSRSTVCRLHDSAFIKLRRFETI